MVPRFYWGMLAIQWPSVVLLLVLSNIVATKEGVCAEVRIKILQTVSLERHFFRQSNFQFQRTNKVACCEPMSYWLQGYSPGEESK